MRATTEQINGVWQGACYPFREGLSTGILNVEFTPGGKLLCGGTNRGWPVRGIKPFALERVEWSGKMPFEINRVTIAPNGFQISFTKPVETVTGNSQTSYVISSFTHPYHAGYGGPESCSEPGEIGALLRQEGLYSSVIQRWRRQLREEPLSPSKKSNSNDKLTAAQELARLRRENERLKEKLRQAELIIDVQKKVSELIQTRSQEKTD
jgi:transposase-like protein